MRLTLLLCLCKAKLALKAYLCSYIFRRELQAKAEENMKNYADLTSPMLVAFLIQKLYSIIMFISHSKSFFRVDKMNFPKFSYCSDNLLHSQDTV